MEKIILEFNTNLDTVNKDIDNFKKNLNEVSDSSFSKNLIKGVKEIEQSIKDLTNNTLGFEEKIKELAKLKNNLINIEINTNIQEVNEDIKSFKKELDEVSKSSFGKKITKEVEKIEQSIKTLKDSELGAKEKAQQLGVLENRLRQLDSNFKLIQKTQADFKQAVMMSSVSVGGFQLSLGGLQAGFNGLKGGILSLFPTLSAFKASLISTGIGAIVVLIGTLIASFTTFTSSTQEGSDKMAQLGAKLTAAFKPFYDLIVGTGKALFSIVEGAVNALNYVTGTKKLADTMEDTVKSAQQLEKTNVKLGTQADNEIEKQETLKNIRDDENQTLEARLIANNKLLVSITKEFDTRKQMLNNSIAQLEKEINQNKNAIGVREKEIELEKLKSELSKNEGDRQGKINEQITNRVSLQRELNQLALENQGISLEIAKVNGTIRTGDVNDQAMRTQMAQMEFAMKKAEIEDAIRARVRKEILDEKNEVRREQIEKAQLEVSTNTVRLTQAENSLKETLFQEVINAENVEKAFSKLIKTKKYTDRDSRNSFYSRELGQLPHVLAMLKEIDNVKAEIASGGTISTRLITDIEESEVKPKVDAEMASSLQLQQAKLKFDLEITKINKDRLDAKQKAEIDGLESDLKIKETELEQISNVDDAYLQKQLEILDLKKEIDSKGKFYELQLKGTFDKNLIEFIKIDPRQSQLSLDEYDKFFKSLQKSYKATQEKTIDDFNTNIVKNLINAEIDKNNQIIAVNEEFSQKRIKAERANLTLEYVLKITDLDTKDALYLQKLKTLQDQQAKALEDFDKNKAKSVLEYDLMINNMRISIYKDFQEEWLALQIKTFNKEAEIRKLNAKSQEELDLIEIEKSKKIKNAKLQQEESYQNNVLEAHSFTAEQIARIDADTVEGEMQLKKVEAQMDIDGLNVASQVAGGFAAMATKQSEERKALLITQVTLETIAGAAKAFASAPPPFGGILSGLVIAGGIANVAKIAETPAGNIEGGEDYSAGIAGLSNATMGASNIRRKAKAVKIAKLATGGIIEGIGTGISDSVPTLLSNGESVINARSTQMFKPLLSQINTAGGGNSFGATINTSFIKNANKDKKQNEVLASNLSKIQLGVSVKEINNVNNRITSKETITKL